jgi:DNA-binding GntR family transcriptional regulator
MTGRLQPGDPLRELHLAREFHVSQATIREALLELEQNGLAVRLANRGTTVTRLSPGEVRDRLEIRAQLEPLACIRAGTRLEEEDLQYLEQLAKQISRDHHTPHYSFYETSLLDY